MSDHSRKPDTIEAMRILIGQIRGGLPFDVPENRICQGPCQGCSLKLLDYMETELLDWERRLEDGDKPNLADLSSLAKSAKKVKRVLDKNGM